MVRPQQNLPGESQQWARSIETDLDRLSRAQEDRDRTLNSTLSGLANSVANLGTLVKTLSDQQAQLTAQQAQLTTTVNTLSQQQSYLTSLKSRDASVGAWSTTSFIADGAWHWDTGPSLTIAVPTGKARVFLRAGYALASASTSASGLIQTGLSYSVSGGVLNVGSSVSLVGGEGGVGTTTSAPIVRVGTVTMPPGTYTFTGYRGYWCQGSSTGKRAEVSDTAIIVEVVNSD